RRSSWRSSRAGRPLCSVPTPSRTLPARGPRPAANDSLVESRNRSNAGMSRRSPRAGHRALRRSRDVMLAGQVAERLEPGQEEVCAAPEGRERRDSGDPLPDRSLRDLEFECTVLRADERIALVAELVEILVVDPHVLRELELANQACTEHERSDPAVHPVFR